VNWYDARVTATKPHEALGVPLAERVDYLMIIASMAGADVVLASAETDKLRQLCRQLELSEGETQRVLAAAHRPTATVERHLDALKASPLRFTLLSDCLSLAYADGEYSKGERKEIHALARALGIDDPQVSALEECVQALRKAADQEVGGDHHQHVEKLAERLAAVGIPVGVVATLSALGLTSAGVSTGAASLLMGLGIASGFGAVLGLSVGTVMGVRWLHEKIAGDG
jgi:uncharacterized tellurite resistance protein B-like protein